MTEPDTTKSNTAVSVHDAADRLDQMPVNRWHRRVTAIFGLGNFFDIYQLALGGILAVALLEPWHLSTAGKSLLIAVPFVGQFLGALLLARVADVKGRRAVFRFNLLAFAALNLVVAAADNLVLLLIPLGLACVFVSAETILTDSYLAELLPARVRGRHIGWCYVVGLLGVPFLALFGSRVIASPIVAGIDGWRWIPIFGAFGGFLVFLLRRPIPESPRWLESRSRHAEARWIVDRIATGGRGGFVGFDSHRPTAPDSEPASAELVGHGGSRPRNGLRRLFAPDLRRRTWMWLVFQPLQSIAFYGFGSLAPLVLIHKGYSVTQSLTYAALAYSGYPVGALATTWLSEKLERKHLIVGAAAMAAICGVVFGTAHTTSVILVSGTALSVCTNLSSSAYHIYQSEIFPTEVRASAIGLCYSLSRATGAMLPFAGLTILRRLGPGPLFVAVAAIIVVLCVDVLVLGPRTRALSLERIAP